MSYVRGYLRVCVACSVGGGSIGGVVERVFGPAVLGIAASQLFAHLEIGVAPESVKVLSKLHRFESG